MRPPPAARTAVADGSAHPPDGAADPEAHLALGEIAESHWHLVEQDRSG